MEALVAAGGQRLSALCRSAGKSIDLQLVEGHTLTGPAAVARGKGQPRVTTQDLRQQPFRVGEALGSPLLEDLRLQRIRAVALTCGPRKQIAREGHLLIPRAHRLGPTWDSIWRAAERLRDTDPHDTHRMVLELSPRYPDNGATPLDLLRVEVTLTKRLGEEVMRLKKLERKSRAEDLRVRLAGVKSLDTMFARLRKERAGPHRLCQAPLWSHHR